MKNKLIKTGLLTLVLFLLIINVSACRNIGGAGLWLYDADNEKLNYTTILLNITNFNTGESTLFNNTPAGAKIGAVVFSYSQVFPVHCFSNGDVARVTANDYPGSDIIFINLSSATTIMNLSVNISKPLICDYKHNLNYSVGDNISILDDLDINCNIAEIKLSAFKEPFKARNRHAGNYTITLNITATNGKEAQYIINLTISDPLNCIELDLDGDRVINWSELKYVYKHCYLNLEGGNQSLCDTVYDFNGNGKYQDIEDMDRVKDCLTRDMDFINHPSQFTIISEPVIQVNQQEQTQNSNSKTLYYEPEQNQVQEQKTLTETKPAPEETFKTILLNPEPEPVLKPIKTKLSPQNEDLKVQKTAPEPKKNEIILKKLNEKINITQNSTREPDFIIEKTDQETNENILLILLFSVCLIGVFTLLYKIYKTHLN